MKCCQTCAQHTNKPSKCSLTGTFVGRKSLPCERTHHVSGGEDMVMSAYEEDKVKINRLNQKEGK